MSAKMRRLSLVGTLLDDFFDLVHCSPRWITAGSVPTRVVCLRHRIIYAK